MSGSHIEGDVERHRVCDKHIIKVAEPSPAVTVVNLSTRGLMSIIFMVPSDQPQFMGGWHYVDRLFTTGTVIVGSFNVTVALLTIQWLEWLAVSRKTCWLPIYHWPDAWLVALAVAEFVVKRKRLSDHSGNSIEMYQPSMMAKTSQLRWLFALTHDSSHSQSQRSSSEENLHVHTAYVHAIMTP